ncbi:MAG: peptidoglycan DD-metalloendopeptidase family protein [Anaerolineae bacterium]
MTCRDIRYILSTRREWTAQEQSAVEDHLPGCPACQAIARDYELMDLRLGRMPEPAFAAALPLASQVRDLSKEQVVNRQSWSWRSQAFRGLALVAVVALAAVALLGRLGGPPLPDSVPAVGPVNGQSTTTLPAPTEAAAQGEQVAEFAWPAEGCISQPYSEDHPALDIANRAGTPVYAVGDGSVAQSGQDDLHGIHITLDHKGGYQSFYSHLDAAHVETGERVDKGQEIGLMGNTGLSTGPHLHFEILENGVHRNPMEVLGQVGGENLAPVPPQEHVSMDPAEAGDAFVWPTTGQVTQGYSDHHDAFDIASLTGAPVWAAASGIVKEVGQDERHGNYIWLEHQEGYETFYSHLNAVDVEAGEAVTQGQEIGQVGSTGLSTGPHLHFQILQDGVPLDPTGLLPGE